MVGHSKTSRWSALILSVFLRHDQLIFYFYQLIQSRDRRVCMCQSFDHIPHNCGTECKIYIHICSQYNGTFTNSFVRRKHWANFFNDLTFERLQILLIEDCTEPIFSIIRFILTFYNVFLSRRGSFIFSLYFYP